MTKQLLAGVLVVSLPASVLALNEHTWLSANHEGVITNAVYWKNGNGWMDSTDDYARLWQSSEGEYSFLLPTAEVNPAYLAFYQMANSTVTLDGADAIFSASAVPDGQPDRQTNPSGLSFFWKSGNYQSFQLSATRNYLYDLSNVLWRTVATFPEGSGSTPEIQMDFARGWFNFAGKDSEDRTIALTMNGNADAVLCPRSMSATITNAVVVAPTFTWAGHATNTTLTVGKNGRLDVMGGFKFGTSTDATTRGTNTLIVTDGGLLNGAPSSAGVYNNVWQFGYDKGVLSRWLSLLFSGEGTKVDLSDVDVARFFGDTELRIADGAQVELPRSVAFFPGVGKKATMTIEGDGTVVTMARRRSNDERGAITSDSGAFELNIRGGVLKGAGEAGDEQMRLYLASGEDSSCVINQSGGTVLHFPTNKSHSLDIGVAGSGIYNLSDGELRIGSQGLQLGDGVPTKARACEFNMTGGDVYNAGDLSVRANNALWTNTVRFNGGVYRGVRIILGGTDADDHPAKLRFEGDGGTFRAVARADNAKYSFLYGFTEAVVGARGFTIDTAGYLIRVRQAFGDKPGAKGVLRYAGAGQVLLNGTGKDTTVSTIEITQAEVRPQSDLPGLGSSLVVKDAGSLNLSEGAVANFAADGLVLGDAYSVGTLAILPTTCLALGGFAAPNGVIRLVGTFDPATTYAVATVTGRLSDAGVVEWAQIAVTGDVPADRIVRTASSYDAETDMTTLSLSFAEAQEPAVENGWKGAASGEPVDWNDGGNWDAGKPDLTSVATFGSTESSVAAQVNIASPATLAGKLAFTANRDYVLTGLGSLFLADTGYDASINVSAGHQTIEVPVTASRNLNVTVAADASLDLNGTVQVKGGALKVNTDYSAGTVRLDGTASGALEGIVFNGGMLEVGSAAVFDGFTQKALFNFRAYGTLRVCGDPAEDEYRLPFDLYMSSRNWGTPEVICNDRPLVVQPWRTSMNSGVCLIKRGKASLAFEAEASQCIRMSNNNGRRANNDYTTLPEAALKIPASGVTSWDYSYAGLNVLEGELALRGTGAAAPSATSQSFEIQRLTLVGVRSTNEVAVAPGLTLDGCWGVAQNGNANLTLLAQNAYEGEYLGEATNAYLRVLNGSTLDAGVIRVGAVADASKETVAVRPRVTVSNSTCSATDTIEFSGRAGCHAIWTIDGDSMLLSGANAAEWNGEAEIRFGSGSVFAKNAGMDCATLSAGAAAAGEMVFGMGSICRASGSTAAEGAAASVAFDGGSLVVPDGTTIDFAAGCGLTANAGGLVMDVPAGETWTLASSVDGPGAVILRGEGTLALSGTISAAFAGSGTIAGGALKKAELRPTVEADGTVTETPLLDGVAFVGKVTVDLGHGADDPLVLSDLVGKTVVRYAGTAPDVKQLKLSGVNGGKVYGTFAAEDGKIVLTGASDSIGLMLIVR